jgi:hypothetical protein
LWFSFEFENFLYFAFFYSLILFILHFCRQEYYRLTNLYSSDRKSIRLKEKERIINNFYRENDLFKIKDLKNIQSVIFDGQINNFEDVIDEEQIFETQKTLMEDNIVKEIDFEDHNENFVESDTEDEHSKPTSPKVQKGNNQLILYQIDTNK